jgi:hypothetical protein
MLLAALRRLLTLLVATACGTAVFSVALGLLLGSSILRSISVGFYAVGSVVLLAGFFVGNRGPARVKGDIGFANIASRRLRWATEEERDEALNMSAVFVTLGFILILLGVVADTRHNLF